MVNVVGAAGESGIADAETMHVIMSEGARGAEVSVIAGEVTVRVVGEAREGGRLKDLPERWW